MPTLLEIERAVYRSLAEGSDADAARHILANGLAPEARLNIYRNTFIGTLTTALRLSFPAVHRLVGAPFFETAARLFIEAAPPQTSYLDEYGADFPAFLDAFRPAASLAYLAGVARLEWAVSRALHAPDADALDPARVAAIDPAHQGRIAFVPHPSIGLLQAEHPVDAIWRAVLAEDAAAMAAIDLGSGPVRLLVQRRETGVEVERLDGSAWRLMAELCAGRSFQEAIDATRDATAAVALAEHFATGRFVGFTLTGPDDTAPLSEASA